VNRDGYDDVIIGACSEYAWGTDKGRAYIFFGGQPMDSISDINLTGAAAGDYFGKSVSNAGDMNKDGYDDVVVGAPYNDAGGMNAGRAYIYSSWIGILDSSIAAGSNAVWSKTGYINGTNITNDFSSTLNEYLRSASQSGCDDYGNIYVDVPVNTSAKSEGNIILSNLSVTYRYETTVFDFAPLLNHYISTHKGMKDLNGNITVPFVVRSQSAGSVELCGLSILYDGAPGIIKPFPRMEIYEDTVDNTIVDLQAYIADDFDVGSALRFEIESATNSSIVRAGVYNNRYLSLDALSGKANDNWTGVVSVRIRSTDSRGSTNVTYPIDIVVRNVNDPPVILSSPPRNASAGIEYIYQITAVDGDRDDLTYNLSEGPQNMRISTDGKINWTPSRGGIFLVSAAISDGTATTFQDFTITVTNRPPRFTSAPPANASVGIRYEYDVEAVDEDNDDLIYSLASAPEGMSIDIKSGALMWTPAPAGVYNVSVVASDGNEKTYQNFSILVSENHQPVFTSTPVINAIAGVQMIYEASAFDGDGDNLSFNLVKKPEGMSIDSATGRILWTPTAAQIMDNAIRVKVTDGRGGAALQEFIITVREAVRPTVTLISISQDERTHGWRAVKGTAIKGTWDIVGVETRIDSGGWENATGAANWTSIIDTGKLKNGKHTLEARAYDGHGFSDIVKREFTVSSTPLEWAEGLPYFIFLGMVLILIALGSVVFIRRRKKAAASQYSTKAAEPATAPALSQGEESATAPLFSPPAAEPEAAPRYPATAAEPATASPYPARAAEPEAASQYAAPPSYQEAAPEPPSIYEIPQANVVPAVELMEVKQDAAAPAWAVRPETPGPQTVAPAASPATPAAPSQPAKKPRTLEEIMAALKGH
jgi:hypothetical protein